MGLAFVVEDGLAGVGQSTTFVSPYSRYQLNLTTSRCHELSLKSDQDFVF